VSLARNTAKLVITAVAAAAVVLVLGACGREEPDLANGKALFVEKCGNCHVLGRAGSAGATGPDLDASFRSALESGMSRETVQGVVERQIANVRLNSAMPEDLVKGADARDVAAYVAFAADRAGEDTGALANAGLGTAKTGDQIFVAAGCGGCHTLSKARTNGTQGPSLDELAQAAQERGGGSPEDYVRESLVEPDAVIAPGGQGAMPSFEGKLSEKQLKTLVEYLLGGK
jgi:mono/diheme cytochrome c family protein